MWRTPFVYLKVDAITDSEAYITPLKTFNDFSDGFGKTQCITGVYEYSEVKFVTSSESKAEIDSRIPVYGVVVVIYSFPFVREGKSYT